MKNTFKMTGYQVTTGQFFQGVAASFVVTAPKADNYRGKVHICHDCFPAYYEKSFQFGIRGVKIGEHFGAAVAACDLTGDGRDDLLVGAPNYGDRLHYNTGRVHVLITTGFHWQRFAFLSPPARLSGARFGSSVGCLALADSTNQVIVGAPYYLETGAVFLFRMRNNKLELSQTIQSPGLPTRGFGLRLSEAKLGAGIAVAAPDNREAFFIRARPVPRFRDISSIRIEPKVIDPKRDKQITVKIEPKIIRMSDPSVELIIQAEVETDSRLTPESSVIQGRTFAGGSQTTPELRLIYNLDLSSTNNLLPLQLNVALKFSLPACTDSYSKPCPVFNNVPGQVGVSLFISFKINQFSLQS